MPDVAFRGSEISLSCILENNLFLRNFSYADSLRDLIFSRNRGMKKNLDGNPDLQEGFSHSAEITFTVFNAGRNGTFRKCYFNL